MIIDKMEAFRALEHYDIRVARTKYVDSAEDAIRFAERRNATDPRELPIVLVPDGPGESRLPVQHAQRLKDEHAIRQGYASIVRELGSEQRRIVAQIAVDPGTDIVITGETQHGAGKSIALHSASHAVARMLPLEAAGAEYLVMNFQAHDHHGSREEARRTLEHLVEKVAKLFEEQPVTAFRLDVRLHENGYSVLDASMTSPEPLDYTRRLDHHAHDRMSYDYHPSGEPHRTDTRSKARSNAKLSVPRPRPRG